VLLGSVFGAGLAPGYGAPKHEYPKHNCTVAQVKEDAETCTPTFTTVCEDVTVAVKRIVDKEQCYPVTRTVCSESIETIPNEICVYTYVPKDIETEAKTVSVVYTTFCVTQMVTVCDPGYQQYGYGHKVHCKEVAQETCYNAPSATPPGQRTQGEGGAHVCKVTFNHLPKPIRRHMQSFGTLSHLLKIPPLSAQKAHSAGGRGGPRNIFLGGILIFLFLWTPCKISRPWEKSKEPRRERKKEDECH
jgi:hypothetical protein